MTRITRRSFSRTGLAIVCPALLLYATATASAADEALRRAFIEETRRECAAVSRNAELTPIVDLSEPAPAEPEAEPAGLRAVEQECYPVGGYTSAWQGPTLIRGNVFDVTEPETFVQFSMELTITSGQHTDLYFILYDKAIGGQWCEVFYQHKLVTGVGRAFYACDPVSVPLSTSKFYLAAVAWQQNVAFGVRTQALPVSYGLGDMSFSVSNNGLTLPGDVQDCPPTGGWSFVDSELYSMRLCFEIPPSACCLPGGTCALLWRSQCQAASGEYTAGRVTCEDVALAGGCPLPPGACCFPGEPAPCFDFNQFACTIDQGGTFAGLGTSCALESCNPRGACCVYGGTCLDLLTHDECIGSELDPWALNVWHGAATECAAVTDCPDLGACCSFTGDSCLQLTQAECSQLWVAGAPCQSIGPPVIPSPCFQWHHGACCLYNGNCQDNRSPYECQQAGGTYRGDNSVCGSTPCDALGACCVGTNCFEVKQSTCVNTYRGNWFPSQQCEPNPCRGELGACCNQGNCSIDNQVDCQAAGGTWDGPSTDCDPSPCTPEGACCIGPLGCDIMTASACSTAGGAYLGDQSTCFECSFTGACCLPDAPCQELSPGACSAVAGTFTSGATCGQVNCQPLPGACCLADGSCQNITSSACSTAGGTFTAGTTCGQVTCPQPTGACCLAGGSCQELSSAACGTAGGTFKGVGTACATPGICDACAAFPGVGNGDYDGDGDVDLSDCVFFTGCMAGPNIAAGLQCRCAFDLDSDSDVDLADFAGVEAEVAVGACCLPDGSCQALFSADCGAAGGTFTLGATCGQANCPQPTGACCLVGGACQELSSAACGGSNGTFKGVGTSCATPGICDVCAAFPGVGNGDYDGDGVANWRDFPPFLGCMTNPGTAATQQCQCAFDFDDDTDVDIDDFGHFQVQYCVYCGCVPFHYDTDADVDEVDYAAFDDCMAGPNADPAPTDPSGHPEQCLCVFDADHDWDVDLLDFGAFGSAFTGPLP